MVAAAIRIAVGTTLWTLPIVRTPKLDSAEYFSWAQRLAAGESAWPMVAQHGPGYPFFLATLLASTGSLIPALEVQALICAVTAVLIAAVASRAFGDRAGLFAGLAYALYGPAIYVETVVLSEGLLILLLSGALWALARDRVTWQLAAVAGAALGAATIVRPTAIVVAGACLCWLLVHLRTHVANRTLNQHKGHKGHQRHKGHKGTILTGAAFGPIVSFVFALAIVVSPVLAKNYAVSQTLSIQGYGGLNVYIGNSPLHDGRATFRLGKGWDALNSEAMRSGITDPAAQDRYYLRKTFSEVASNPLGYVRLLARKTLWMLQAEEPRDTHSYYFFTDRSSLLRMLLRFAVLFPLACIGVFAITRPTLPLHVNRRWTSQPAVTLLAFYTLAVAATEIFLVIGLRYRMPLVPALVILAGAGADGAVRLAEARRTRQLLICCAIALTAVLVSHVLHDPSNVNVAEEWAFTGSSLITEHNLPDAEQAYRRALELEPQSALAWDGLGLTLYNAGRLDEARTALQRALAIDPQSARAAFHLALVDEREGRLEAAASGYERALSLSPYDSEVLGQLAAVRRKHATELGMAGRTREARDEMKRALDASAADGETWLDLCLLSLDLGDREEAAAALQRAKNLGADPARIAFAEQAFRR